jgi:hypothetical protein
MPTLDPALRYHAYVLRFWREGGPPADPPAVWRFSLEDVETGERRGFINLDTLVAFLRTLSAPEHSGTDPGTPATRRQS